MYEDNAVLESVFVLPVEMKIIGNSWPQNQLDL